MTPERPHTPILCISSIDWDFIWQGHQEIMSTLAKQGHRVLFVENTGVRNPRPGDFKRIRQRLANWRKSLGGFRQVQKNLTVYSPLVLPFPYFRLARWINRWLLLRNLRQWMEAVEFYHPIIWTFLPTPLTLDLIRAIPHQLVVYYCIDSFADSTPAAQRIVPSERTLLQSSDLVFVTSRRLQAQALEHNRHVHLFPFGVSFQAFQAAPASPESPPELEQLKRPIIGYVGGVHQWVDQELLAETAQQMPECTFALAGPLQTDVSKLREIPNVKLLGQLPHDRLPQIVRHFDVGLIPYRLTEYTHNVYPTKLNEYHALGKPVVSTPLPEIITFNEQYDGLVNIADTPERFSKTIQAALKDRSPDLIEQRVAAARDNGWDRRINSMQRLINAAVSQKERTPPNHWAGRLAESWKRSRRATRWAWVGILLALVLFKTPLAWSLAKGLTLRDPVRAADAIVVFAGGVGESGEAGEGYQERVQQAVALYRRGLAPQMLLVSGYTRAFHETDIMRALARELNVPTLAILTATDVQHTLDYVLAVEAQAQQRGWEEILLVTSPYHSRRADLTFQRNSPDLTVIHAPVPKSTYYAHRWGIRWRQLKSLLHELAALLYYKLRGWI